MNNGTRKPGPGEAGVKNMPVACFSGRGRVHGFLNAVRKDPGQKPIFVLIGFAQPPDKQVFAGMPQRNAFPRGEGAPVRTLGRMRNGDMFRICLQFGKKYNWKVCTV